MRYLAVAAVAGLAIVLGVGLWDPSAPVSPVAPAGETTAPPDSEAADTAEPKPTEQVVEDFAAAAEADLVPPQPEPAPPHEPAAGPVDGLGQSDDLAEAAAEQDAGPPAQILAEDPCARDLPPPIPTPGDPARSAFWSAFREPLPPAPVWNPPGPKRVGLQAGHWRVEEAPPELSGLSHGTFGGGKAEWEVNLDIARRAAAMLEEAGVEVDVLPAIIPPRYQAHVFISIHADGDLTGRLRGYKIARASSSAIPEEDDRLVQALYEAYGEATGLRRDDEHITRRMTAYYAFNSRRYCHAVMPGVPSAIVETGFLTSAADRELLIGRPDIAARGLANGVLRYLGLE